MNKIWFLYLLFVFTQKIGFAQTNTTKADGSQIYVYASSLDLADKYNEDYLKEKRVPQKSRRLPPLLSITSLNPAMNQNYVLPNSTIQLSFDKDIQFSTANSTQIQVRSEQIGNLSGTYTVTSGTVTFTPSQAFRAGDVIHVTIQPGLLGTDGSALTRSFQYEFRIQSTLTGAVPIQWGTTAVATGVNGPEDITAGDIDKDGDMDIAGVSPDGDQIFWLENTDGTGNSFSTRIIATLSNADPSRLALADLDQNGTMDIIVSLDGLNQIRWYRNDGSQNFTAQILATGLISPQGVHIKDIDGDGDLDVLTADFGNDDTWWLVNNGAQTFTINRYLDFAGAFDAYSGDMDKDGDVDFLVGAASFGGQNLNWYRNGGSDDFTNQNINIPTTGTVVSTRTYLIDMDDDGDMDILATFTNDDLLAWFENNGSQSFTQRNISNAVGSVVGAYPIDIDGDGDIDVLAAASNTSEVVYFENNGSQSFTRRSISTGIAGVVDVYAVDIDGDKDLDVISQTRGGDRVFLHKNLSFRLLSASPSANASGINPSTNLVFTFDAAVTAASVGSNIKIRGEQTGLIAGVLSGGGTTTITFNPTQDFKPGEVIFVDVIKDLISVEGINLGKTQHYEFRVAVQPSPENPTLFQERVITLNTNGPKMVYAADMDKDGDLDVLTASNNDNKIAIQINDGNQSFTERVVTLSATSAQAVYASDIDGDGDLDVLSASFNDNKVSWYQNDGNLSFTERVLNSSHDGPGSVFAIDIDGDGDLDVVSASYRNTSKMFWYENQSGTFVSRQIASTANGIRFIRAADMDRDGDVDLLTASFNDDRVAWYENDGSQNFTLRTISTQADFAQGLYPVDLDKDGDMDVISASENDNEIAWYQNDGNQIFTQRIISNQAIAARSVYAADVNGDGFLDVLSASLNDDKIAWYQNDGNQNFTARTISTLADGAEFVYAADMDGDGDLDVLSASDNNDKVAWYENLKIPFRLQSTVPTANASGVSPSSNISFNFDAGISDANNNLSTHIKIRGEQTGLISGTFSGGGTGTITFDPNQNFKAGEVIFVDVTKDILSIEGDKLGKSLHFEFRIATQPSAENPTVFKKHIVSTNTLAAEMVYAADMDKDGDMDVLSASNDDNKIAIHLNNGNQSFTEKIITTSATAALAVYAADMDNDGDLDVLSASFGNNKVAWYQNDGSLNFTERVLNSTVEGPGSVFAVDIDGDGDLDVVSASYLNASRIFLYENLNNGTFSTRQITPTPNGTRFIRAADMDKDGDVDLFTASFNDDQIAWYENDGNQNFTLKTVSTLSDFAQALYPVDLDKDGDMDVLAASQFDNEIAWYQNNGSQLFTQRIISNQAIAARSVYAADVNGDGFLDVLSASLNDNKIAWYQNDGNQNFTARTIPTPFIPANEAEFVYAADVDGDGDLDVLSASDLDNTIAWYENVFVDDPPTVLNPIFNINTIEDAAPIHINLSSVFGDTDSDVAAIGKSVYNIDNAGLVTATVNANTLTLTLVPDAFGTGQIVIEGNSQGLTVRDTFLIQVSPVDDPPYVANPMPDIVLDVNSPDRFIDISNVFADVDNESSSILTVVQNNTAPTLLKVDTVKLQTLRFQVLPNQVGTAQIILQAFSGVKSVRDTFLVTVRINPPINLRANPASEREIELNWQHENTQSDVIFEIQRSLNREFDPLDRTFESDLKQIVDSVGLSPNITYFYRVRTRSGGTFSTFSNITASQASNVPRVPANLTLSSNGSTITLNWQDRSDDEIGFRIERASLLTLNNFIEIATVGMDVTTLSDSSRQANLTYIYRVRAFNSFGNSPYSEPAEITLPIDTNIPIPISPINLMAESISTRQIDLQWEYNLDTTTLFIVERTEGISFLPTSFIDTITVFRNDRLTRQKKYSDFDGLVSGQFYAYRVIALNGGGKDTSQVAVARAICNLDAVIAIIRNDGGSEGDVICQGRKASLIVIPYLEEARYQWRRNGIPIPGANFATYLAGETGLYDCEVGVDTCSSTALRALQVVVNGQPRELEISFDGILFRAIPEDANLYQWFVDFEPIPGANQSTHKPVKNGFYYALATFGTGVGACKVSSNIFAYPLITAQEDLNISDQIQVFPNPHEENFLFLTDFGGTGAYQLSLSDLKGQVYLIQKDIKSQNKIQEVIKTSYIPSGVYLLQFHMGKYWGSYKIIKY
ncbi:MAG: FG-GAP-like repeat-containing protein [Microscillaceae bacterium]|nr:FG-GAP-like repeat-containing protein [Microscillaceae bacterium]